MPQIFDQFTQANATSPLIRLEPLDSVQRIVEEHIGSNGGSTGSPPVVPDFITGSGFMPWSLHDVTLFVTRDLSGNPTFANNTTQLLTVDPFSGLVETTVGNFGRDVRDIAMHPGGRLHAYTIRSEAQGLPGFADALTGNYLQIDPGNASIQQLGDDAIATYQVDPASTAAPPAVVLANDVNGNGDRRGEGVHFQAIEVANFPNNAFNNGIAGLAIGGRDGFPTGDSLNDSATFSSNAQNILYVFNPNTGAASGVGIANRAGTPALIPGTNNPGTDVVERAILNTFVDANPVGQSDVLVVSEATTVDGLGNTQFEILDRGYPIGPTRPPEIPTGVPSPTTFQLSYFGPATTFEFDAGPEAIMQVNNTTARHIRDGQGFTVNGATSAFVEFDTGNVLVVTGGATAGNFADGTFLDLLTPDPTGLGQSLVRFEFDNDGTFDSANIQINTVTRNTAALMATAIQQAVNTATNLTVRAEILPAPFPAHQLRSTTSARSRPLIR